MTREKILEINREVCGTTRIVIKEGKCRENTRVEM